MVWTVIKMVGLLRFRRIPPKQDPIVAVHSVQSLNALAYTKATASIDLQITADDMQSSCENLWILSVCLAFTPGVACTHPSKPDDPFVQLLSKVSQFSHGRFGMMDSQKAEKYQ